MDMPPFNKFLGTEIVRGESGDVEAHLELLPHHLNKRGVAHGGVISSLLDSALGAAVIASMPSDWWCATTSLNTQFLAGPGSGRLVARGRVVRRGRKIAFAEGEIVDGDGRLIAKATGSWHLWSHKPGSRPPASGPWVKLRGSSETSPVGKILAVGRNYAAHNVEMGNAPTAPPILFLKPSSAIVHDGATITLPQGAGSVHHETELVAVIGRAGKAIAEEHALDHLLGYAVGLDLTLRDLQSEAKKNGEPWSLAKGFDGSAPISDVVPAAEVGDGSGLAIELRINGERRQSGNTSQMTRSVAQLIAHASQWMRLERGDLIFTGTPAGVGPIEPGERLEATIERIGRLSIHVAPLDGVE